MIGFISKSLGTITSYRWNFGDGTEAFAPTVIHKYYYSGIFSISLTVSNGLYSSTATYSLDLSVPPGDPPIIPIVPVVVNYTYVVSGLGVQFTDISTKAGDRLWDFDDGKISTESSPYHLYDAPGIYDVSLTIQGNVETKQVSVDYGIILNWTDNSSDETGFRIEHSPDGITWSTLATVGVGVTTYTVTYNQDGIDPAVENYFRVYAYNGVGDSTSPTNTVMTQCEG